MELIGGHLSKAQLKCIFGANYKGIDKNDWRKLALEVEENTDQDDTEYEAMINDCLEYLRKSLEDGEQS